VGQCQRLMQRCTDEIRRYDRNHIVFVERVAAVKDMSTGENLWNKYSTDELWFLIDDDNAVYEGHFYTPHAFTHQSAGDSVEYPKPCYTDNYLDYWAGCMSARQTSQDTYYESGYFTAGEDYNLYAPVLHSSKLGSGTALFDDVTVTEYAPDGTSGVVWHNDFSDGSQKPENVWSSDGTGSWSMSAGYLKISGGTDDYVLTFDKLKLREGCKYKISGHMQTVGAPSGGFADIRADFSLAENVYESGREYVFAELSEIVRFGKENNVPIYLGEFGADAESFKNGLGGERWVADVMDFCNENGISYSYHAYHEPMFGFYPEDTGKYPQRRNEALAKVFADKNRNG
jgi:endoglucanase